jgi:hypothetical protein
LPGANLKGVAHPIWIRWVGIPISLVEAQA